VHEDRGRGDVKYAAEYTVSVAPPSGVAPDDREVYAARATVANAVLRMQGALQQELHEEHLQVHRVLGRGGFGTVYHGALLCFDSIFCSSSHA
jgi:hypothetical protein